METDASFDLRQLRAAAALMAPETIGGASAGARPGGATHP